MSDPDLDAFFARHIPLTRAMGIHLARYDADGLALAAPLAPNVNDKGTAFAGSLASIITLSGWSLTHLTLLDHGERANVVIARSRLEYRAPVREDILAECTRPSQAAVARLLADFRKRGKARWELEAVIRAGGITALEFRGLYVAYAAH